MSRRSGWIRVVAVESGSRDGAEGKAVWWGNSVDVPDVLKVACLSTLWGAVFASHFWDVHGWRDEFAEWGYVESWYPVDCGP